MRAALALGLCLLFTACNEHAVDECFPLCSMESANEELFAECVAYGNGECQPGDRRCCALDLHCLGEIGDQVVIGNACPRFVYDGCAPTCDEDDIAFFDECTSVGTSSCDAMASDVEECCAFEASCRGSLGPVAVDTGGLPCCDDGDDCVGDDLCNTSIHECVTSDCTVSEYCPPGHDCVGTECLCGTGPICHDGDACVDGECADNPCVDCDGVCLSDFTCVECVDDFDCDLGFECDLATNACVGCASADTTCDGFDDDCDGEIDEEFPGTVSCGVGACVDSGTADCESGAVVNDRCVPGPPVAMDDFTCDGVDDDCDGMTDEDCCGNGVINGSEECDRDDLGDQTCMSFAFDGGTLACLDGECAFDDSGCTCNIDVDMDRYCFPDDCVDDDANVHPDATEVCNGEDEDCDVSVDEGTCDDGNDCTANMCDGRAGACNNPNLPSGALCSGGTCDGSGSCVP